MDGLNGTFRTVVGTVYVHGVSTAVLHAEFWYETLRDPAIFVVYAVFEVESWPTTEPKHQSSTTAKTSIVGSPGHESAADGGNFARRSEPLLLKKNRATRDLLHSEVRLQPSGRHNWATGRSSLRARQW